MKNLHIHIMPKIDRNEYVLFTFQSQSRLQMVKRFTVDWKSVQVQVNNYEIVAKFFYISHILT